jgi:hypothetical protein
LLLSPMRHIKRFRRQILIIRPECRILSNDNGQITTEERTWAYELNTKQLPYKIAGGFNGQQETTATFKY